MSKDGGRTLHEAGGVWVCETELQQPMVLHLLLSFGCAGTRQVLQELSTEQRGQSHCRELLAASWPRLAPRIAPNFMSHTGLSSLLLLLRPWGSFAIPPSSSREPSLSCAHHPNKGSRAAPVPGSLVLGAAAGSAHPLPLPGEHQQLG